MNVIFAHDHKLRFDGDNLYTLGGLSDTVTNRYTDIFDHLTIICRAIDKQPSDNRLFEIKNPKVSVTPIKKNSPILSIEDKRRIRETVAACDAVIVRLPSFIGDAVYKYAKIMHKPIFVEVVTCPWDSLWNYGVKGKLVAPYMVYRTKKAVREADYTLYVTQKFLQRRYPTKGVNIGLSDVELLRLDDCVLDARLKKIESNPTPLVLGTLAALNTSYKGQQFVIEAMSELKKKGITVIYRLAGGGSPDYLLSVSEKHGVRDQLFIDGIVPHEKVFDWIDQLDLYIQPSLQEGLPRALVEAMSRACPAIGSRTGGIPELLGEDCIFDKKDVSSIVKYLQTIDKSFLIQKSRLNFNKATEFDKTLLDKKRKDFYESFKNFVVNNK